MASPAETTKPKNSTVLCLFDADRFHKVGYLRANELAINYSVKHKLSKKEQGSMDFVVFGTEEGFELWNGSESFDLELQIEVKRKSEIRREMGRFIKDALNHGVRHFFIGSSGPTRNRLVKLVKQNGGHVIELDPSRHTDMLSSAWKWKVSRDLGEKYQGVFGSGWPVNVSEVEAYLPSYFGTRSAPSLGFASFRHLIEALPGAKLLHGELQGESFPEWEDAVLFEHIPGAMSRDYSTPGGLEYLVLAALEELELQDVPLSYEAIEEEVEAHGFEQNAQIHSKLPGDFEGWLRTRPLFARLVADLDAKQR